MEAILHNIRRLKAVCEEIGLMISYPTTQQVGGKRGLGSREANKTWGSKQDGLVFVIAVSQHQNDIFEIIVKMVKAETKTFLKPLR